MHRRKIFLICAVMVVICYGVVLAQKAALLPDLSINSVDFVPIPKENGSIDLLKISVGNQGEADAAACILGLSCTVIECNQGNRCEEISSLIHADIAVPAIKKGEKINLEWRPTSSTKWISGKYTVVAEIDKYNAVQESNETNNINKAMIFVTSLSPRMSTAK
jgi:hypothetical protein